VQRKGVTQSANIILTIARSGDRGIKILVFHYFSPKIKQCQTQNDRLRVKKGIEKKFPETRHLQNIVSQPVISNVQISQVTSRPVYNKLAWTGKITNSI